MTCFSVDVFILVGKHVNKIQNGDLSGVMAETSVEEHIPACWGLIMLKTVVVVGTQCQ